MSESVSKSLSQILEYRAAALQLKIQIQKSGLVQISTSMVPEQEFRFNW